MASLMKIHGLSIRPLYAVDVSENPDLSAVVAALPDWVKPELWGLRAAKPASYRGPWLFPLNWEKMTEYQRQGLRLDARAAEFVTPEEYERREREHAEHVKKLQVENKAYIDVAARQIAQ